MYHAGAETHELGVSSEMQTQGGIKHAGISSGEMAERKRGEKAGRAMRH